MKGYEDYADAHLGREWRGLPSQRQHQGHMSATHTFSTERLPLAIGIHASGRLRFLRCEQVGPNRVEFVFDDREGHGSEVELAFDRGTLTVVASQVFASQKFLRRQMSAALDQKTGEMKHGYKR
jgi:hypothetical protein